MLAQQVFNGLALGMGYALIAVGYSLVFGILRLVNFSHGSIYAFGAEIAMVFIVSMKFGIVPGILLSMLVTGALGIMIDKIALEPLLTAYRISDYHDRYFQHYHQPSDCIYRFRKKKLPEHFWLRHDQAWQSFHYSDPGYDVCGFCCSDADSGIYRI